MNKSYLALCQLCAGEVKEPWKFLPSLVKNLKKRRCLQNWCFPPKGRKGEMRMLYKLFVCALPHQWHQVQGNSNCSWGGNNQMLLWKWSAALEWRFMERTSTLLIFVSSFHPLNPLLAAGAETHSHTLLLCPTHPLILLLPPPLLPLGTHPQTTAMQLCLFHGRAWSQLCRTHSS